MTATEVLRRMLDERGVEYDTRDGKAIKNTYWNDEHGRRWGYTEDVTDSGITSPILFLVSGPLTLTPEQAIAATLGDGTCHDKGNIERFICSECGCRLALQDDDWEATMWLDDGAAMVPRFCPNCGRKVVDE